MDPQLTKTEIEAFAAEEDISWNLLWRCTQIASADGFKFELCDADKNGNRVGVVFRFFSCEQIDDFLKYSHLRSNIILDANETMMRMMNGESLVGDVSDGNKIEWEIKNNKTRDKK